jgi:hypothetical protein
MKSLVKKQILLVQYDDECAFNEDKFQHYFYRQSYTAHTREQDYYVFLEKERAIEYAIMNARTKYWNTNSKYIEQRRRFV